MLTHGIIASDHGRGIFHEPGHGCYECDADRSRTSPPLATASSGLDPLPPGESETGWQETTPDPIGTVALPAFPVYVLPAPIEAMVGAVAEFTQTDPAMAGTTALGVLAACAGGRLRVEVRPDWREPVNLFTVTVAAPGERKSAVQSVMTAPLMTAQKTLGEQVAAEIQKTKTEKEVATRAAERAAYAAAKSADPVAALADALSAAAAAAEITIPVVPRILADDVTPEAAGSLLADHGGRSAIISAEGGIFDIMGGGRYNTIPNLDIWLKGHAGDRLMIDRKGRPAEHIECPALTVSVMVQEQVLRAVGASPVMRGRGLLARFLYCLPASRVGWRTVRSEPMSGAVTAAYSTTIRDLAITLADWTDPAVLTLTEPALNLLLNYAEQIEIRMRPGNDLAPIADWANKLVGAVARITALLHIGTDPTSGWKNPVGRQCVTAAIRLGDYYAEHALAAFDAMAINPVSALARIILAALQNRAVKEFTVRELRRLWVQNRDLAEVTAALTILVDAGWIRAAPTVRSPGPGRPPSPRFVTHPRISTP